MNLLFAALGNGVNSDSWGMEQFAIAIVIIAAVIGVVLILLKVFGVTIPQWAWAILGICVAAFLGVIAIKFLFSL